METPSSMEYGLIHRRIECPKESRSKPAAEKTYVSFSIVYFRLFECRFVCLRY